MELAPIENGFQIIPETEFEKEYLSQLFINQKKRHVLVKSGTSLGDVVAVNVTVANEQEA